MRAAIARHQACFGAVSGRNNAAPRQPHAPFKGKIREALERPLVPAVYHARTENPITRDGLAVEHGERMENRMLDGYGPEELRQVVRDLADATAKVAGKASLAHAAAMRAIRTGAKADAEQFFLHLGRLDATDQVRIAQKRDSLLIERWTQAVFGSAEPTGEYWSRWKDS